MIQIREGTLAECKFVYTLSRDKLVRDNSFDQSEIDMESHIEWYNNLLVDPNRHIFILSNEGVDYGIVRFTKEKDYWVVGISIIPEFRGKGFAEKTLKSAIDYLDNESLGIHAFIKKSNLASIRVFEKNDFVINQEIEINNIPSVEMIWK